MGQKFPGSRSCTARWPFRGDPEPPACSSDHKGPRKESRQVRKPGKHFISRATRPLLWLLRAPARPPSVSKVRTGRNVGGTERHAALRGPRAAPASWSLHLVSSPWAQQPGERHLPAARGSACHREALGRARRALGGRRGGAAQHGSRLLCTPLLASASKDPT